MTDGPFPLLSRRRLLKLGLGAGGALAAGVGGLFALRGTAPAVEGLRVLGAHEYRTFAALAQAAFPEGVAPKTPLDLARAFDGFLADEPDWAQSETKSALLLLELGPVLFERRLVTFSHLDPDERVAHFQRWGASDSELRRQVFVGFKKFLCLVFYDQPEVWPMFGYEGPLVREAR
ncbi:MAG: hypothetical protein ACOZQL_09915 [Myxococcota bacterium]